MRKRDSGLEERGVGWAGWGGSLEMRDRADEGKIDDDEELTSCNAEGQIEKAGHVTVGHCRSKNGKTTWSWCSK